MDEKELMRKWQSLTIQSDFIFSKTMENYPELCRRLLEKILNFDIKRITYIEREKVLKERTDSKGVRLDVYVEEKGTNRVFDIEMQIANADDLAKRMRYYQGLIDMDKLKPNQVYKELGESYIIFICPFDLFKQGRHIYTFKETCAENPKLLLGDGSTKIFLNTKGTADDVSANVKSFLSYVDEGIIADKFVKELDDAVQNAKFNRRAMKEFMTYEMTLLERERQGIEKGIEQVALNLSKMKMSLEEIHKATNLPIERIKELVKQNESKGED